jgi:hypothetical protein
LIEITRLLARQFRAMIRRCVPAGTGRGAAPTIVVHTGADGLRLQAQQPDVAVELHQPGLRDKAIIALPAKVLDDCQGARPSAVIVEPTGRGTVQVRWDDGGVPQTMEYDPSTSARRQRSQSCRRRSRPSVPVCWPR